MKEIWKPIIGYEKLYEISNLGRVKSLKTNKIRKSVIDKRGYYSISLCKNGKHKNKYIHRLLMEAFVPNLENKPCIDHIDGNRLNNSLDNLRWCTHWENNNNPSTRGKMWINNNKEELVRKILETRKRNGGKFSPQKVYAYLPNGTFYKSFYSIGEASKEVGKCAKAIQSVLNNNHKIVGGYLWSTYLCDSIIYEYSPPKNNKIVQQLDKKGNIIKEWESVKKLALEIRARNYITLAKHIRQGKPYMGEMYIYKS